MKRRGPRGLSDEDLDLWRQVAKTATPMRPDRPDTAPKRPDPKKPARPRVDIPAFRPGQNAALPPISVDVAADISARMAHAPVRMDKKTFTKIRKGRIDPEGRIDLHGMTLSQAHPALIRFVMAAHAQGKRLILVITGKGRDAVEDGPIPLRRGVLRHQVPHWLDEPPLGSMVLQVTPASRKHGGEGAYYVYLRRR
ncbi:Smr/MutS family protein [Actibacterium ureilyticum]|uniref:Smr/MutS family protein n=1 Tax=Actibacterium ureilyticum TaxID=1590614 RepID=UPI000BAAF0CC|nr:Smr/MutS family protein [Actibacterium ureilyticum]